MKYDVEVNNKKYSVSVTPQIATTDNSEQVSELGADISFEVAKEEYEYCIHRSEKLDNKIYILLTVCAFLATIQMNLIQDFYAVQFSKNLSIIGWVIFITELSSFLLAVIFLVIGLRPLKIQRFVPKEILHRDMVYSDKKQVAKYICIKYVKYTHYNNGVISKRYKVSNIAIFLIAVSFISMFLLRIFINQFAIPEVKL